MRLRELYLENFRCYAETTVNLNRPVTLIFGVNGAGKSALVDALALALSVLPGLGGTREFLSSDLRLVTTGVGGTWAREQETQARIGVRVADPASAWEWRLDRGDKAKVTAGAQELARQIQRSVDKKADILPVFAVYGAGRAWRDVPPEDNPAEGRLAGYAGALDAGRDLSGLRAWWRDQDHTREKGQPTPALDAAERAVVGLAGPSAALPIYDPKLKDVIIDLPRLNGRFALRELSDGYRGLIALVADIARRAATLNPVFGPGLLTKVTGVVIIDEIDLHLHPKLQAEALPRLRETFPNIQLIVTTHSPLVLGSVRDNEEVLALEEDHTLQAGPHVEGRDPARILAEVMGAPLRPLHHEQLVSELYQAIDARDIARAEAILRDLGEKWGELDPEVVQARTYLDWER